MNAPVDPWSQACEVITALRGRPAWDAATVAVRESDILRFQDALGDPIRRVDTDGTLLAPPMFLPPFAAGGTITSDGRRQRPGEAVLDQPGLRNRVLGGVEAEFLAPMRAGETITATSVYEEVTAKAAKSGPMMLVTIVLTYTNELGEVKRRERRTTLYRPARPQGTDRA
jgi:hydroxyacyl-ACP dehydratase HTD2-like protein with hotdog domain